MLNDQDYMLEALALADQAEAQGEVPVGAVLVYQNEVIGRGYNQVITQADPSAHAEMLALREGARFLQNYRLLATTLYVTLEPCPMCAGLLIHGRIQRLVYGASDFKTGACGSVFDLARHPQLNHQIEITAGVLQENCANKLSAFFRHRRSAKKALRDAAKSQNR